MQSNLKTMGRLLCAGSALVALLAGAASANAATITYDVDQIIGAGSVTGTVTTDGTIGPLAAGDFTAWSLLLTGAMGATFRLDPANSQVYEQTTDDDVVATKSKITFNFSGTDNGYLLFQEGTVHLGQQYWCNATFSGICLQGKSVSSVVYPDSNFQNIAASGTQVIAGVPEPSTWFLMALGFAALGTGAARRAGKALLSSSPV